ncbi:hypothetical protein HPB52_012341 [Rhipicephalus sanguineus]|uniref:Uncharacterized protein n=1 Tax=Rhipicephalus sanguineus TaxID=34632 RepID=A0A9D4YPM2_RHISA|nr:hypothetical protein HPB52_012341 [Rhipicephalus sanguineus]
MASTMASEQGGPACGAASPSIVVQALEATGHCPYSPPCTRSQKGNAYKDLSGNHFCRQRRRTRGVDKREGIKQAQEDSASVRGSFRHFMHRADDIVHGSKDRKRLSKSHCQYRRLRPGSVPTIFPGCPSYLSVSDHNTRETPDAKRSRKEASQLAHAVEESLASYEAEQERDRFSSLEELKARLQVVSVSPKWTVIP